MKKTVVAGGFICLSQSQPARPLITNNYQSKQQISTRGGDTTHKNTRTYGKCLNFIIIKWHTYSLQCGQSPDLLYSLKI